MTVLVDFVPAEYIRRRSRVKRLRAWILLSLVVLLLQFGLGQYLSLRAPSTRQMLGSIARERQQQRDLTKKIARKLAEERKVSRQLGLAQRLKRKHLWSETLHELAGSLPAYAVLTRVDTSPPRARVLGQRKPPALIAPHRAGDGGQREEMETAATGLSIEGIAKNHEAVAALLRALEKCSRVGTSQLKSTLRQPFMDQHGIHFSIQTRWTR